MPSVEGSSGAPELYLEGAIGFGGEVPNGLVRHPDGQHILYPLGSTIVIKDRKDSARDHSFMSGHTNLITCLAVSKSGRYVASGQQTHMGYQADIIVWDFASRSILHRLTLHKVKVQALAFSPNECFLASLGGQDDNQVLIWDLAQGKAICGAAASKETSGCASALAYSNLSDHLFVTGGAETMRVWDIDTHNRKLRPTDCQLGQIKRVVKCIAVDERDEFLYAGTTTGDVLQISIGGKLFKQAGPPKDKDRFGGGVLCIATVPGDAQTIIAGAGNGVVAELERTNLTIVKKTTIQGQVTSVCFADTKTFQASTALGNVYTIERDTFHPKIHSTCHTTQINDICFPHNASEIVATASNSDVRIWNVDKREELLRIIIPGIQCRVIGFNHTGNSLVTGWSDGKIRSFGPETGRLQFEITDAHKDGSVTAFAVTKPINKAGDFRIVSGGEDGEVRIWRISGNSWKMEAALKEHKGTVSCIKIRKNDAEAVSSSSDGSCIIWDLNRFVRNQVMFAPSFFKAVAYYPEENQLLTSGTDRKVAYWEAFDGSLIREIEATAGDSINALDITQDGQYFVIGGSDKQLKVYHYEEGVVAFKGHGHSTEIHQVRLSPDQRRIVSVSSEGALFMWTFPVEVGAPLQAQ